ncbi:MAG: SPFH domain-containing protein [Planctomycetota bacterium]|nr:SPFH domain-containing protein [Planctomycetota bacterium]
MASVWVMLNEASGPILWVPESTLSIPNAGEIILVPTTNFVLHWITNKSEDHNYDAGLRSIELITKDAYEPLLPLSVVVHIDYKDAPGVIQRFGDVKPLITQTIDPLLSAYFRDIAHSHTMLELIHNRADLQKAAKAALKSRFQVFDIQCVDVLIGKPDPAKDDDGRIDNLLEQLRNRQLSMKQIETYKKQQEAATQEIALNAAKAKAAQQENITRSKLSIEITANKAQAELGKARKEAEQVVVTAGAQKRSAVLFAEGASTAERLRGEGESSRVQQGGDAEAEVIREKVLSFGNPSLYTMQVVSENLAGSEQLLVPEQVLSFGGQGGGGSNMLEVLLGVFTAEKMGFQMKVNLSCNGQENSENSEDEGGVVAESCVPVPELLPTEPVLGEGVTGDEEEGEEVE